MEFAGIVLYETWLSSILIRLNSGNCKAMVSALIAQDAGFFYFTVKSQVPSLGARGVRLRKRAPLF
jgi:hypothetical protein